MSLPPGKDLFMRLSPILIIAVSDPAFFWLPIPRRMESPVSRTSPSGCRAEVGINRGFRLRRKPVDGHSKWNYHRSASIASTRVKHSPGRLVQNGLCHDGHDRFHNERRNVGSRCRRISGRIPEISRFSRRMPERVLTTWKALRQRSLTMLSNPPLRRHPQFLGPRCPGRARSPSSNSFVPGNREHQVPSLLPVASDSAGHSGRTFPGSKRPDSYHHRRRRYRRLI